MQLPIILDESDFDTINNDKSIFVNIIKRNCWLLKEASEKLKDDNEVVLIAVRQDKTVVRHASERIKALCEGKDPVKVLENTILAENLNKELSNKEPVKTKKLKI